MNGDSSTFEFCSVQIVVVVPKEHEEYHEGYWEAIIGSLEHSKDAASASMQELFIPWRVEILPLPIEQYGISAIFNAGFDLTLGDCIFPFDLEGKKWHKGHVIDSMKKLVQVREKNKVAKKLAEDTLMPIRLSLSSSTLGRAHPPASALKATHPILPTLSIPSPLDDLHSGISRASLLDARAKLCDSSSRL